MKAQKVVTGSVLSNYALCSDQFPAGDGGGSHGRAAAIDVPTLEPEVLTGVDRQICGERSAPLATGASELSTRWVDLQLLKRD